MLLQLVSRARFWHCCNCATLLDQGGLAVILRSARKAGVVIDGREGEELTLRRYNPLRTGTDEELCSLGAGRGIWKIQLRQLRLA